MHYRHMRLMAFFLLLLPLKLFAGLTCGQVFNNYTVAENSNFTEIQIVSFDGLKASEANVARNTINRVNTLVGKSIKVPSLVKLEIEKQGSNAEFDWADKIVFPLQYLANGKPKHPKYAQTILAHEYGHFIFSVNLRDAVANYAHYEKQAKLQAISNENVRKSSDAYVEAITQRAEAKRSQNTELISEMEKKVEDTERAFFEASDKMDQITDALQSSVFNKVSIISYHELFADIIAVVNANHPSAMSDVLRSASIKDQNYKLSIESRNFLNRIRLNGWNQAEPHMLLAPTRRFIWDYILNNPRYNQNTEILVKEVLFCLQKEILSRIEEKSFQLTPEEINRRLIDRLSNHFQ